MGRTIAITSLMMVVVLALLGACNDDNDTEELPQTPEEILERASDRFSEVDTAQFTLDIEGEVSLGPGGMILLRGAEGEIARPDSAEADASITFGGTNLAMTLIAINGEQFITDFVTGQWQRAPEGLGYNPAILFDDEEGIAGVLEDIEDPEIAGSESVNGRTAHHIRGSVARETVRPMTAGAFDSDQIDLDIWIAEDNDDVLRIVLHDSPAEGEAEAATWTLQISDQNEPVTIERPEV